LQDFVFSAFFLGDSELHCGKISGKGSFGWGEIVLVTSQ